MSLLSLTLQDKAKYDTPLHFVNIDLWGEGGLRVVACASGAGVCFAKTGTNTNADTDINTNTILILILINTN